ncbi:MAG: hypothetical protein IPO21_20640 [Bacteroidales bacterium]|nr:hypothetical protein [Bacteroidales bacterium]
MNIRITLIILLLKGTIMFANGGMYRNISVVNDTIKLNGRYEKLQNSVVFGYPGTGISIRTDAKTLVLNCKDKGTNFLQIIVNDKVHSVLQLKSSTVAYMIKLEEGIKNIVIIKRTETEFGNIEIFGISVNKEAKLYEYPNSSVKFMFIGNSITCGYGNEAVSEKSPYEAKTENSYLSYASMVGRRFGAETHLVAYSGRGIVRNWAQIPPFRETMNDLFQRALANDTTSTWNHGLFVPQYIFINLGTNDTSPGYDIEKDYFIAGYKKMLNQLFLLYPESKVVMLVSQMLEPDKRELVNSWLSEIKSDLNKPELYLFELSKQDGSLGFGADYHPSIKQNEKNALELELLLQNLWTEVRT